MYEKCLDAELLKKKMAYPYECFGLSNFEEPLNLTKENFRSTLKQETPPDEEIIRTQENIKKVNKETDKNQLCYT